MLWQGDGLSRILLLVSAFKEDEEFATAIAETAGLTLQTEPDPGAAASLVANADIGTIMLDASSEKQYQDFEAAIQSSVGIFSDKINANTIHFICSEDLENAKFLTQSPMFGHFVLRNYTSPKENGERYGRLVKATLSERAFGLENLLKPGTKVQTVKLKLSTQKQDAVEAARQYMISAKFPNRIATVIANAVDELLMNAIFDAPVDSLGKPLLSSTSRKTALKLEGQNQVEMQIGFDGNIIGITASDSYGSLDKNRLMSHISKVYNEEEYKVKATVAGAGLGLATVFHSGGSFFFVSENRVKTEVSVFFQRHDSYREFKDQFRFLSSQFYF